jgi:signal transduction histidine kinase
VYPAGKLIRTIIEEVVDQYNLPASSIVFEKNDGAVFPYIPAKFIHDGIDKCECRVDKSAIRIVFDNLTDNSIKYSNDSVQIVIRMSVQLSKLVIEFKDKGIGIPSNELKKIFNKFYRVYGESIPNIKGTGLGLYWVREIIRSHNGKISVSSEGINKGTTFRIELPIYKRPRKILVGKNRRINYA